MEGKEEAKEVSGCFSSKELKRRQQNERPESKANAAIL